MINVQQIDSFFTPEEFCRMKTNFRKEISPRRLATISSFSNLLNVLHKQDVEKNEIFEKMKNCPESMSNFNQILKYLAQLNGDLDEKNMVNLYGKVSVFINFRLP